MARRPFACLLAVASLALALVLALLALAFPAPLAVVADRCTRGGGLCLGLMRSGRMLGGPVLLASLPWSLWLGAGRAWRLGRATGAAVTALCARGAPPSGALEDLCAELGLAGRVVVVVVEAPLALCAGLVRPRILISRGALARLGPEELAAVLCHERTHLRHRHPLQLLVAAAVAAALPFLPLLRELAGALPRAQELAADRAVIRAGGRRALGRALLALLAGREEAPVLPLAAGVVGVLDARLDQLAGDAAWVPRFRAARCCSLAWCSRRRCWRSACFGSQRGRGHLRERRRHRRICRYPGTACWWRRAARRRCGRSGRRWPAPGT